MDPKELYSKRIEKAVYQAAEHITDDKGEPPLWPMNIVETLWYLSQYFSKELFFTLEKLKQMNYSNEDIASLFKFPTRITYLFHHTEFPILGLESDQCEQLFLNLMDFVEIFRKEDVYCEKAKNILWNEKDVSNTISRYPILYKESTKNWNELTRNFGRLNATLWMFTEFIHAAKHPYSHEFHGPYPVSDNLQLIVRHYYDLKIDTIWPFLEKLPYSEVFSLELYKKDIDVGFTFFNHSHTHSSIPLPQALQGFYLGVGESRDKISSINEIISLQSKYQQFIEEGNRFVEGYSKKDWHKKLLELHFYYLKPLKDALDENWKPSKSLYNFIDNTEIDNKLNEFMNIVGKAYSGDKQAVVNELVQLFLNNIYNASRSKYI